MQEAEEQDTCRICSAPAEPDQPLFHPCKCSGTIRYIHQDCLTTWLAHSKKKDCDVCKHPYTFNKVYAPNMPARLPPTILLRHLAYQSFFLLLFSIRAVIVGVVWLAVLPWITVWTWRMYFTMGDSTAWWISDRPRPDVLLSNATISPTNTSTLPVSNITISGFNTTISSSSLARLLAHPAWRTLSADIFAGQIIASLIVLIFITVFLLREWIAQNARPGMFGDDELPPLEIQRVEPADRVPVLAEPQVQVHIPDQPAPLPPPPPPPTVPRESDESIATVALRKEIRPRAGSSKKSDGLRVPATSRRRLHSEADQRPNVYHSPDSTEGLDEEEWVDAGEEEEPRRRRVPAHSSDEGEGDVVDEKGKGKDDGKDRFEFTFRATARLPIRRRGNPGPLPSFQLDPTTNDPQPPSLLFGQFQHQGTPSPRRPPMPATTVPTPGPVPVANTQTPLASPNLATYRAPEELGGYFETAEEPSDHERDNAQIQDEDAAAEHAYYFREHAEAMPLLAELSDSDFESNEDDEDKLTYHDGVEDQDVGERIVADLLEAVDGRDQDIEEAVVLADDDENGARDDVPPPDVPANAVPPAPENDELAGGVEDDIEGAMEAIGMRGPIHGVIQNAALMVFVLDTAIGLGVWLPFTIGKSMALLSLDPQRLLQIVHLPIRAMRIVTDPVVDSVMYVVLRVLLPFLWRHTLRILSLLWLIVSFVITKIAGTGTIQGYAERLSRNHLEQYWGDITDKASSLLITSPDSGKAAADVIFGIDSSMIRFAEPYFAVLGKEVQIGAVGLRETYIRLALGHGTSEKIFAVILGYIILGLTLALYLNVLTVGNVRHAGRAVRSAVRQQLLVVKVATFIVIELVVFPLGCGLMLDLCTIWIFPEASIHSRAFFFLQAPITAMFYHWVAGTMFMYQFAILLAGCRAIMRPGAMWFIKDPQDQNFHPIRDILDRPTFTQLRKLMVSAVMYALVVICGVASIAGLLVIGNKSILPFRWKNREPLSNVPIDLLFLHLVLPYTMHYFRPKQALHSWTLRIWKYLAIQLRLTSYMFGDRRHSEEYTPKRWNLYSLLLVTDGIDVDDPSNVSDGSFRRVPATDNLALPRETRATAEVFENGEPVDDDARKLMSVQNAEAEKAKRDVNDDYKVVYIPPNFKQRIMFFIFCLWIVGSFAVAVLVALPIQLGRMFFSLFVSYDVHDGYSFIAGFYLIWACYLFGTAVDRMDRRRQRRGVEGPRAKLPLYVMKHGLAWMAKTLFMVAFFGFVIPTLFAIVLELYVILPVRLTFKPEMMPRIRVVDMWALGLLYSKIALRALRHQPANRVSRGLTNMQNNGWTNPEPVTAAREVIIPVVLGLLGMIFLPAGIFRALQHFFPSLPLDDRFIFVHVYPGIFAVAGFSRALLVLADFSVQWMQSIRDKEFLVEMRLRNHEPEKEQAAKDSSSSETNVYD